MKYSIKTNKSKSEIIQILENNTSEKRVDTKQPILSTDTNTTSSTETVSNLTYLKIVSNYNYSGSSNVAYIYRVGLAGYSFEDLRINYQESKTFELQGIPGGLNNVNVNVAFKPDDAGHIDYNNPAHIKCNFTIGKTTTLTLSSEGKLSVSY